MIELKFDNTLIIPSIEVPIYNESKENDPKYGADGPSIQSKTDGIFYPLLSINNVFVPFQEVVSMELSCTTYPKLQLVVEDTLGIIKTLDNPNVDNLLQLQIIPPFDNAYKKINLMFYITDISIYGTRVDITGVYNVPEFWDTTMESYGCLTSYEFFETIAKRFHLGFCSNISGSNDPRYIYSTNNKIVDVMEREIRQSGDGEHVYEFWIDFWNNINFIDIYNEYNLKERDENMQVWIPGARHNTNNSLDNYPPMKTLAMLTNLPMMVQSPLYITSYTPVVTSPLCSDKIIEIFNFEEKDTENIVIVDGDVKNDIFKEYQYFGENFGKYKYLYQKATRDFFINKISAQTIEVTLPQPVLGLMRGGKTIVYWYELNKYITQEAMKNTSITSNISLPDNIIYDDSQYIINASISGQYYIVNSSISFQTGKGFSQSLVLGRPAEDIQKYK